ncbi:hypothetical protein C2E31_07125 [Rhodopirellula baltica]|nr:hypothetical protein C2E31_07125 [Rhodopirellula baltica]
MDKNDLDALKLLADWSKWIATTQSAVITLIGYSTVSGSVSIKESAYPIWVIAAMFCFLISLISASFILFALPGIAQRLPPPDGQDVLTMGTLNGSGIRLFVYSAVQFACFALGISCLVIWSILQLVDWA